MVDPVIAADGISYERKEITQWLASNNTSPKTNLALEHKNVIPNLALKQQIERLVVSGALENELCSGYLERKEAVILEQAQKLYDEGKVEEAAALGLPEAQGEMANRCHYGRDGVAKDLVEAVEWAKKAAAGGDKVGQFRLGFAYRYGEGCLLKDCYGALKWYEKAAEQGCTASMINIGALYFDFGWSSGTATAYWYRKAAEAGDEVGQRNFAHCCYTGMGVPKNLETARSWLENAAAAADAVSMRRLGYMFVKGEGGAKDIERGIQLWESAAELGDEGSQKNLDMISANHFLLVLE